MRKREYLIEAKLGLDPWYPYEYRGHLKDARKSIAEALRPENKVGNFVYRIIRIERTIVK